MTDWLSLCAVLSLLLSLLTVAAYILYTGLLTDIIVLTGSPPIKKITFAYKFKEGPYQNCGQLFKESQSIGPTLSCIGVFYDDPKKVPGPQCRYAVGSILSEGENQVDEEFLKLYETSGFNVFSFPEVTHVVTTSFPHRTFFSILMRMNRVYPRLELYIKGFHADVGLQATKRRGQQHILILNERHLFFPYSLGACTVAIPSEHEKVREERRLCAHPFLEIYRGGRVQFMAPLARQGDFYVPEARQAERRLSGEEELESDTDISGADSNSEYSSGSGVLLSDSRETSLAASSVHSSVLTQDQEDTDYRGSSSGGKSFKELDWGERTGGQQGEGEEWPHGGQKSPEVPTQRWWGVVGGEE